MDSIEVSLNHFQGGDESKVVMQISGKAYVKGFEVTKDGTHLILTLTRQEQQNH